MAEKIREIACDPLKCLGAFCTINFFMFGVCGAGYWNLDSKMEKVITAYASQSEQIKGHDRRIEMLEVVRK